MTVKASVSITNRQDEGARALVQAGRYSSLSAVVQRGLELVLAETDRTEAELAAIRAFFAERDGGPFVSVQEGRNETEDMIAAKLGRYGV